MKALFLFALARFAYLALGDGEVKAFFVQNPCDSYHKLRIPYVKYGEKQPKGIGPAGLDILKFSVNPECNNYYELVEKLLEIDSSKTEIPETDKKVMDFAFRIMSKHPSKAAFGELDTTDSEYLTRHYHSQIDKVRDELIHYDDLEFMTTRYEGSYIPSRWYDGFIAKARNIDEEAAVKVGGIAIDRITKVPQLVPNVRSMSIVLKLASSLSIPLADKVFKESVMKEVPYISNLFPALVKLGNRNVDKVCKETKDKRLAVLCLDFVNSPERTKGELIEQLKYVLDSKNRDPLLDPMHLYQKLFAHISSIFHEKTIIEIVSKTGDIGMTSDFSIREYDLMALVEDQESKLEFGIEAEIVSLLASSKFVYDEKRDGPIIKSLLLLYTAKVLGKVCDENIKKDLVENMQKLSLYQKQHFSMFVGKEGPVEKLFEQTLKQFIDNISEDLSDQIWDFYGKLECPQMGAKFLFEVLRNPNVSIMDRMEAWKMLIQDDKFDSTMRSLNWVLGDFSKSIKLREVVTMKGFESILDDTESLVKPTKEAKRLLERHQSAVKDREESLAKDEDMPKNDQFEEFILNDADYVKTVQKIKRGELWINLASHCIADQTAENVESQDPPKPNLQSWFEEKGSKLLDSVKVEFGTIESSLNEQTNGSATFEKVWPLKEGYTISLALLERVMEALNKYRHGLGLVNILANMDDIVKASKDLDHDAIEASIYKFAIEKLNDTRQIDFFLQKAPDKYIEALLAHSLSSKGWLYLCHMVNYCPGFVEARNRLVNKLAGYLAENAILQYPHHGIAFMLLFKFGEDDNDNYKGYLGSLYSRYARVLKSTTTDNFELIGIENDTILECNKDENKDTDECKRMTRMMARNSMYKKLHDLIIVRLFEVDAVTDVENANLVKSNVVEALKGMGKDIFMYGINSKDFEKNVLNAERITSVLAADVNNITKDHWDAFFKLLEVNNEVNNERAMLFRKVLLNFQLEHWRKLVEYYGPKKVEDYLDMAKRKEDFGKTATMALCTFIQEKFPSKETVSKEDEIIYYRLLDAITEETNEGCKKNLFAATLQFSKDNGIDESDNPLEALAELINIRADELENPIDISSALFTVVKKTQPKKAMLEKALEAEPLNSSNEFKEAFEKFILEVIVKEPYSKLNQEFIERYEKQGADEQKLMVKMAKVNSPIYIASENLRIAMGEDDFNSLYDYIKGSPLPELTGDYEKDSSIAQTMVKAIERVMNVDGESRDEVEREIEAADTLGLPLKLALIDPVIKECDMTLRQLERENFKDLSDECLAQSLVNKNLEYLMMTPKNFRVVATRLPDGGWNKAPSRLFGLLTKESLTILLNRPAFCESLVKEENMRQLHFLGLTSMLTPECLKSSGEQWIWGFIPDSKGDINPNCKATGEILDRDNFADDFTDKESKLELLAPIGDLWRALASKTTDRNNPCTNLPIMSLAPDFWLNVNAKCLRARNKHVFRKTSIIKATPTALISLIRMEALAEVVDLLAELEIKKLATLPTMILDLVVSYLRKNSMYGNELLQQLKKQLRTFKRDETIQKLKL